jgi:hypothetical protein
VGHGLVVRVRLMGGPGNAEFSWAIKKGFVLLFFFLFTMTREKSAQASTRELHSEIHSPKFEAQKHTIIPFFYVLMFL